MKKTQVALAALALVASTAALANGVHMSHIAVVYHSGYGHTKRMAEAVNKGAEDINYVGSFSGAMAQSPSDSSPDEMLPGDLETARLFGKRVSETAARLK